ncbi:hypothetical protein ACSLBF_17020 [Pseudoalteromonas sp. T1lg65]|uniref:hypothetical protein n=1 Tax=Pseudoalteromonas sp. T1lg65 TaxID=2077101 RepID=UPI003F7910A3
MKLNYFSILLLFSTVIMAGASHSQQKPAVLEGRYFGQKSPGLTPKPFAPGIIATEAHHETEVLFSTDMTELSFTRAEKGYLNRAWILMQYQDGKWHNKKIAAADIPSYQQRFSPPLSDIKKHDRFKDIPIIGYTTSAKGTFYFYVLDFKDGSGHLSYSRLIDGKYEQPHKMSDAVNKGKYIAHPFIAPDESYLMWDAEVDGASTPDIFISFRNKDGSWGEAISMGGAINTPLYEQRPKVTPDGKYLTFWRGEVKTRADGSRYPMGDPYWVDAKIIEIFRAKYKQSNG